MAIFDNRIINEKEIPNTEEEESNYDLPEDEAADDATTEEPGDEEPNYDLPEEDEEPAEDEEPNYDLPEEDEEPEEDGDEPEGEETEGEDTDIPEDTEGDDAGDEEDSEDTDGTEEDVTEELFKDLTDEQKAIRDKELYRNFYSMYTTINDLSIKINKIPTTGNTLYKIDTISKNITDLKEILYDYIMQTFSTKTYLENHKMYYEFIVAFNEINKMLENLAENEDK